MLFVSAYIVEIHSPSRQLMRATAVDIAVVNRTDSGARRTIISFACASVTYVPFICVSVMYLPFMCQCYVRAISAFFFFFFFFFLKQNKISFVSSVYVCNIHSRAVLTRVFYRAQFLFVS